jgi:hypothetical protein
LFVAKGAPTAPPPLAPHSLCSGRYTVGDQELCPALELCARFLKPGTSCLCFSEARFAYGSSGGKGLPRGRDALFMVTLHRVRGRDDLTVKDLVEKAEAKKGVGNEEFGRKE